MSYTQFILLLRVWDAILGLCLIQNKTKQNRTPSQNSHRLGPAPCALCQASGLSSLLAVGRVEEGDGEEERDPGVGWCAQSSTLRVGVGKPTCIFA